MSPPMGAVRIIVLAVALVAAIGLALMVRHMATPKPAPTVVAAAPPVEKPTTKVMVAKTNLAIGHRIERDDTAWQPWPVESLNPAFTPDGAAPPPPVAAEPAVDKKDAAKKGGAKTDEKKAEPVK